MDSTDDRRFSSRQEPKLLSSKQAWLDEEALWRDFQQGNLEAYAFLYQHYAPQLYSYGRHLGGTHELVKDCIQELFEQLWGRKHKLSPVKAVRSYLLKAFRRMLLRKIRQERKRTSDVPSADFCIVPSTEENLIEQQTTDEQQAKLINAINRLPVSQREALYLKFYQNLGYPEIATAMKISVQRVYNLISRAIRQLKQLIGSLYLIILILGWG